MRRAAGGIAGLSPQKLAFSLEKEPPRSKKGCKRSPDGSGAPTCIPALCIPRLRDQLQAGYQTGY